MLIRSRGLTFLVLLLAKSPLGFDVRVQLDEVLVKASDYTMPADLGAKGPGAQRPIVLYFKNNQVLAKKDRTRQKRTVFTISHYSFCSDQRFLWPVFRAV